MMMLTTVVLVYILKLTCAQQTNKQEAEACGGLLSEESGVITSPNYPAPYPPSSNCRWTFRGGDSDDVLLEFKDFELERHRECRYDFVNIKKGEGRSSDIVGKYCGANTPGKIKIKGSFTLDFVSDTITQKRGFKATWKSERKTLSKDCGGRLSGSAGELMSPNYLQASSSRIICKWTIVAPEGKKIRFRISDINIKESEDCAKGYIQVKQSIDQGGAELGLFCGTKIPSESVLSDGNILQVIFLSKGDLNSRGFKAVWSAEHNVKSTPPPDGHSDTACGRTFTENTGIISRSFSKSNCTWKIRLDRGERVRVNFLKVNLASDRDCRREQVEIRDENAQLLTRTCGNFSPRPVTSTDNEVVIHYIAFSPKSNGQFKLSWKLYDKNIRNSPFDLMECGISKVSPQQQTSNIPQGLGTLPWVVGIIGMFGRVHCGGTILSKHWILTAAHCFSRLPWTMLWKVRAGEWDLMKYEGKEQNRDIKKIFIHPKYNSKTNENDIAMVHLKQPLVFNDHVSAACLPLRSTRIETGKKCSIAGWGARKFLRQPKEPLAHVQPEIVSKDKCNRQNIYNGKVSSTMLCAGGNGADSCQGDGGSGLTCTDEERKYRVIGIASWGNGCAFPDKSGVYTDVRSHLEWIKSIVVGQT